MENQEKNEIVKTMGEILDLLDQVDEKLKGDEK